MCFVYVEVLFVYFIFYFISRYIGKGFFMEVEVKFLLGIVYVLVLEFLLFRIERYIYYLYIF